MYPEMFSCLVFLQYYLILFIVAIFGESIYSASSWIGQTIEARHPDPPSSNFSIIFTTAFKDIGRDKWKYYARSTESYYVWFLNLARNLPSVYPLIVYLEPYLLEAFLLHFPDLRFRSNLYFRNYYSVKDSFYTKYLEIERAIISSDNYQQKIPPHRRENNPEHLYAEYNLMNHAKINFLRNTFLHYPNYGFYAWIDFGYIRELSKLPSALIDYNKLSLHHVTWPSLKPLPLSQRHYTAEEMLVSDEIYLQGGTFIIPQALVLPFESLYEQQLLAFHRQQISDDDQNLLIQIYQEYPDLFLLYECDWFELFSKHLNR